MKQAPVANEYLEKGFLNNGPLLGLPQVEELRCELDRVFHDKDNPKRPQPDSIGNWTGGGDASTSLWQIVNIWKASDAFRALVHHPRLTEMAADLLETKILRVWHDQIQYKPKKIGGMNFWHQDHPYWDILDAPRQVTAWIALDEVDEDNGCMYMVPGSHTWGNNIDFLHSLKSSDNFFVLPDRHAGHKIEVVPRPVHAGHVHFHHALTWHGSPANTSGRLRRAIAIHYMADDTHYVASGVHICKKHVRIKNGDVMRGRHFPVVFKRK